MKAGGVKLRGDDSTWHLSRKIGEGRHGVVFRAYNDAGREGAAKCVRSEYAQDRTTAMRLVRELAALRSLQHRAFVDVLDQGLDAQEAPFFVMELLGGETLSAKRLSAVEHFSTETVLGIAQQALEALNHAHQRGIIHRDLSPNNFLLTRAGELKLLDLGICRAIIRSGSLSYITGPVVLGTPGFIAPEQVRCETSSDERVDLWSLGAVLFFLLSGKPVHEGSQQEQIEHAGVLPPRSLESVRFDLPTQVISWIDKALAFDASARWQSASEMLAAIPHLDTRWEAPDTQTNTEVLECCATGTTTSNHSPTSPVRSALPTAVRLVFDPAKNSINQFLLEPGTEVIIGRSRELADWHLNDPSASRTHVRLRASSSAIRLADLSSRNGTYVNGILQGEVDLRIGDVIRVGDSILVVCANANMDAARTEALSLLAAHGTLLVTGESGVGKDHLIDSILETPESRTATTRVGSETQGLVEMLRRFLDSDNNTEGRTAQAPRGMTLRVDDIGYFPIPMQSLLLQMFDELASARKNAPSQAVSCRQLIATTSESLWEKVQQGRFRMDLYARLANVEVKLAPLRERRQDILPILHELASSNGVRLELDPAAAQAIVLGTWATNVRGLESLLRASGGDNQTNVNLTVEILAQCASKVPDAPLGEVTRAAGLCATLHSTKEALRHKATMERYLTINGGKIASVARELGTTRAQVYRWLKRLGIDKAQFHRAQCTKA